MICSLRNSSRGGSAIAFTLLLMTLLWGCGGGSNSGGGGGGGGSTAPSISSLNPSSGSVGTTITIAGTNFGSSQGSSTVTFNGTAGTPTSWSAASIVAPVPTGATTGNVVVTVGGVASNGMSFTVNATPNITSLSPTSGPVGTTVTITGTNFGATQGSSTVTFNATSAGTATTWSATSITVSVPTGATTGNVVVTVGGVASNGMSFTVIATPNITGLSPTSGPVGTTVTITGTNFGATQGSSTVTFNATSAGTATTWSATSITVSVPTGATTGNVVVRVGTAASNGVSFTVTTPAPTISSLSPTSGPAGTSVTITGTNFGSSQSSSTVTFNGTAATPTSWSATSITVSVPTGATTGNVVVTVNGTPSSGVSFAVTPNIASLSPTSGAIGASVTITGTTFGSTEGSSTVTFNGTAATPTSWSATSIVVPVPTGASSGNVVVTVGGIASNGVGFNVVPPPSITSLSATSGAPGLAVTITGANFGATQGSSTVTFNGTAATPTSWSATSITVNVPSGATSGNVVVTVGGVASNGTTFNVVPGMFALVQLQHTNSGTCLTGASAPPTCTLTWSQPTQAGDFGVVTVGLLSFGSIYVTSITDNQSSTWTVPGSSGSGGCTQDSGNYGTTGCGYNLSLPAGITSLTVNWSATVPEGAEFDFREYSYNGGPVALDGIGIFPGAGSVPDASGDSTVTGATPVITGSIDVIVQALSSGSSSAQSVTTYQDLVADVPYYGAADLLNTTDTTPPVFTMCCANVEAYAAIAISFKPDPPAAAQASITPARGAVTVTQPIKLTAAIAQDESGSGVLWSASAGGKVTEETGTSASFSATAPGVYTVKATSVADRSKTATATLAVTDLAGVYTYRYDVSRDGANSKEYALNASNVNKSHFGKLFSCAVDGAIYGQPLWAANLNVNGAKRNVVFVATKRGSVYAFDADASPCTQLWHASVGEGNTSGASDESIADTTWIDPSTNTLYVADLSAGSPSATGRQQVRGLDLLTGNEKFVGPLPVDANAVGSDASTGYNRPLLIDLPENGDGLAHLLVETRADGFPYVMNRASLTSSADSNALQRLDVANALSATSSFWNNRLYIAGGESPLYSYQLVRSTSQFAPTGQSSEVVGHPGATTAVSASGAMNGIVWALEAPDCSGSSQNCGPATLHAYEATNIGVELWNSSMVGTDALGSVLHSSVATVANGRVYVGTSDNDGGQLVVYGLKAN